MGDWPTSLGAILPQINTWQTLAGDICKLRGMSAGSGAMSAARAYYIPFWIEEFAEVTEVGWENGATVNGTVDMGVYDLSGRRMVSSGPQTQTGTSTYQSFNVTDTPIQPGSYYMAICCSSGTATLVSVNWGVEYYAARSAGIRDQTSVPSSTLPATATMATPSTAYRIPNMSISLRWLV